ncbi:MAG: DegT/DnrJ/EryC1/StrS family aminotransferase [Bacteroidales bacterium]|jgi:dTDP-4-amino-4,6-dideoxygalactose transaminase|nr:DegT/DnrJ/EryC1/StrS family aminotransferase [Bacteroidales bacterium]
MIRLIKPFISFEDIREDFQVIFNSGILTKGTYVSTFAETLCEYTGSKYCFFTTSATTALSACLKIIDIKPGDEVLLSDFSFPATANVVEDLYAYPVFVDVDPETYNMRPDDLEKKITKKTKAVIFVDALGNPSGIHLIKSVCEKHNIPLIEDAACALGSSESTVKCGNIADLTCVSFHPRKLLTTGEGGAILTNNEEYKNILNIKFAHGATTVNGKLDFVDYGYNYRLPELQAAMGIKQLEKLDDIIAIRQKIRDDYINLISSIGFTAQKISERVLYNVQSVVFTVPSNIRREKLIQYLKKNDIESTIGTYCLSACTYYRKKYNNVQSVAKCLYDTTITFPCYLGIDVETVCNVIGSLR